MSINDAPAGDTGGLFSVSDLPERLRVHALARLIGRTSREVLAALADVGSPVSSAQAGVDRKTAEQVVTALVGPPVGTAAQAGADPASPVPPADEPATSAEALVTSETPEAAATVEAPAKPTRSRSRRKKPAPEAEPSTAPTTTEPTTAGSAVDAGPADAAGVAGTTAGAATVGAKAGEGAENAEGAEAAESPATDTPATDTPAKPTRSRSRRRKAAPAAESSDEAAPATADTAADTEADKEADTAEADTGSPTAPEPAAAEAALSPLFAPPAPLFQPPAAEPKRTRSRRKPAGVAEVAEAPAEETQAAEVAETEATEEETPRRSRRRGRGARDTTPEPEAESTEDESAEAEDVDQDSEDDEDSAGRRRRRRGRRGRGRGRGENGEAGDENGDASDEDAEDDSEESDDTEDDDAQDSGDEGGSRRRRRRRRRKGSSDSAGDSADDQDDPPNTVTKVRQTREREDDGVQSVRGSTRLEAKRQRRRDGRDAGRCRPPILSESEFLARRESVERSMIVRQTGQRTEIGVLEDDVLVEHFIAGGAQQNSSMVGNIYLGRVQNVLPSMEAAFVDIGRGRNAVLYAGEVDWDAAGLNGKARRIEQALSSGDSVLVQVTKDPVGHKGARLTTQISLAGRFLVYVPSGGAAGISRKLPDVERKRLKDMLKEIVPSEAGVIIRTASEGVSHEALERDVRRLQAQWEVVKEKATKTGPKAPKAPTLLYEEPDLLVKVVRDQFNEDFASLVVSGDEAWQTVSEYITHVAPELADRMHRHVGPKDVFAEYRIDEQLLKALDRKVWLPSGGTLVIDRTEAMTVVDVNTGKFTGSGGNLEETVTRNNLEAAEEVVRQLRLRDVGGIIVIDFIDMVLEANRDLVLRRLTECLARDRTRHQVAEVTSLGLVQMTRKRVGGGLLEHFSTTCEHCRGRGVVVTLEGVEQEHDHGQNGQNGHREESGGGRRRNRRGRDERPEQPQNGRSSAAAAVAMVAAATQGSVDTAPVEVDDVEAADLPAGIGGTPIAEPAPVGMDEADTGRPAKRRGRRRAERPAGGTGAAEAVVVTTDASPADTGSEVQVVEPSVEESAVEESAVEVAVIPETAEVAVGEAPVTGAPATGLPATGTPPVAAETAETAETVETTESVETTSPVEDPRAAVETAVETAGDPASSGELPASTPAVEPAVDTPTPRRRRGRVTRSAGAPSTAAEPVVVAVPESVATENPSTAPAAAPSERQPETAVVSRPRRSRRGASRPAGPPVDGEDATAVTVTVGAGTQDSAVGTAGGDPV